MNKKQLRYAFNKVIKEAEQVTCEMLHHPKKHQHGDGDVCLAEQHLHRQIHIIKEYMKQQEI